MTNDWSQHNARPDNDSRLALRIMAWLVILGEGDAALCHGARKTGHVRARYTGHLRGVKIRHLAFSNPLLKETIDGEAIHDGRNRHDPYTP